MILLIAFYYIVFLGRAISEEVCYTMIAIAVIVETVVIVWAWRTTSR
ncbi:MAG: hypothetical protein JSW25_07080 [Thermoplasmata archaeon]|nr:MAG: hypothetical protein JSW25_07080 [Thermoplasmata archaeon]